MKKKLMIGAGVLAFLVILALPFMRGNIQVGEGGAISYTSKTTDSQATETLEKETKNSKQNSESKPRKTTEYRKYTKEEFDTAKDKARLIFFKKPGDFTSDQVHALLVTHINDFKKGVVIFHANMKDESELVKNLAVSRPGTVLKFDESDTISTIFVAPEHPQLDQIRKTLDI